MAHHPAWVGHHTGGSQPKTHSTSVPTSVGRQWVAHQHHNNEPKKNGAQWQHKKREEKRKRRGKRRKKGKNIEKRVTKKEKKERKKERKKKEKKRRDETSYQSGSPTSVYPLIRNETRNTRPHLLPVEHGKCPPTSFTWTEAHKTVVFHHGLSIRITSPCSESALPHWLSILRLLLPSLNHSGLAQVLYLITFSVQYSTSQRVHCLGRSTHGSLQWAKRIVCVKQ